MALENKTKKSFVLKNRHDIIIQQRRNIEPQMSTLSGKIEKLIYPQLRRRLFKGKWKIVGLLLQVEVKNLD